MQFSLLSQFSSAGIAFTLFVAMIGVCWVASRLSSRGVQKETTGKFGPVEGSLLGLLAFLLAFTFSMSASRYDARRHVLIEEANDIGTAVLRADLYSDEERRSFRADFKEYVEARIAFHEAGFDQ